MPINVYAAATPFVIALALAEFAFCSVRKNGYYSFQDSIASMGTAVINQCVNVAVALLVLPLFSQLTALAPWKLEATGAPALIALFLGVDFLFYWFHRFGHRVNIGWAAHSPHHSTEELNYAVALRASVTQRLFSFLFYWPLVVVGFSPEAVLAMVAFHLVLQVIPHTRVVPKLPRFIESWMNTPSHHRVHHARNDRYLDKNYGGFLIIWDRLFGSYAEETEECSYGVTTPPNTWDPTVINFQGWAKLLQDAVATESHLDRFKLWLMPTGWRPADLQPRVETKWRADVKFRSVELPGLRVYLVGQLLAAMPLMLLVSHHASPLNGGQKVGLSILLWALATAWAGLLESKSWAMALQASSVAAIGVWVALWSGYGAWSLGWAAVSLAWLTVARMSSRTQRQSLAASSLEGAAP